MNEEGSAQVSEPAAHQTKTQTEHRHVAKVKGSLKLLKIDVRILSNLKEPIHSRFEQEIIN
jgi:hypothetical protein